MAGAVTGDVGRGAKFGAITGGILGGLQSVKVPMFGERPRLDPLKDASEHIPPPTESLLSKIAKGTGSYLKDHPEVLISTVSGVGGGLMKGMAVKSQFEEEERIRRERQRSYSDIDYDSLNDLLYAPSRFETTKPPPSQPAPEGQPAPQSSSQQQGAGRSLMGSGGEPSLLSRSASEILEGLRVKRPLLPSIA